MTRDSQLANSKDILFDALDRVQVIVLEEFKNLHNAIDACTPVILDSRQVEKARQLFKESDN